MEQKIFNKNKEILEGILDISKVNKTTISNLCEQLPTEIAKYLKLLEERDTTIQKYIEYIDKFNFSDEYTSPSVFPGIRTHSENIDLNTIKEIKENMLEMAKSISSNHTQLENLSLAILQNLKSLFTNYVNLNNTESNFFTEARNFLKELDSVYDIGNLASLSDSDNLSLIQKNL